MTICVPALLLHSVLFLALLSETPMFSQVHCSSSPCSAGKKKGHSLSSSQDDDKTCGMNEINLDVHPQRFWGTWRPNLYFGTRTQSPETVLTGLMWFPMNQPRNFLEMRHECKHSDGLLGFGYVAHNGNNYARQVIPDVQSNVQITTEWVANPLAGQHGGGWALRVAGVPISSNIPMKVSLLYYAGRVSGNDPLSAKVRDKKNPSDGDDSTVRLLMRARMEKLGDFSIYVAAKNAENFKNAAFASIAVEYRQVWKLKDNVMEMLSRNYKQNLNKNFPHEKYRLPEDEFDPDNKYKNVGIVQLFFEAGFEFFIIYNSDSTIIDATAPAHAHSLSNSEYAAAKLQVDSFNRMSQVLFDEFESKFKRTCETKQMSENQLHLRTARFALANLIGGMGYFYGESIISPDEDDEEETFPFLYDPTMNEEQRELQMMKWKEKSSAGEEKEERSFSPKQSLFTATPSRSFFPRGFLWDEGFHQLILSSWDLSLSTHALTSWLNLVDKNGWVAREQILGDEARSRVPEEFREQKKFIANPPTIMFTIKNILRIVRNEKAETETHGLALGFLKTSYPILKRHIEWIMRSQRGRPQHVGEDSAFRWRGRTKGHTFACGLDDYPRLESPSLDELHVDLTSWVAFALHVLADLAKELNVLQDELDYRERAKVIEDTLVQHFWDANAAKFGDIVPNLHDEDGSEAKILIHTGYITLMPWLLVPDAVTDEQHAGCLETVSELLTPFGVRSLSSEDKYYGQGDDYWRGRIWINFQYLILRALKHFEVVKECRKSASLYRQLRESVIRTITAEFDRTGHIYETYSDIHGEGVGTHPFTGWSSLIILIMREDYV